MGLKQMAEIEDINAIVQIISKAVESGIDEIDLKQMEVNYARRLDDRILAALHSDDIKIVNGVVSWQQAEKNADTH